MLTKIQDRPSSQLDAYLSGNLERPTKAVNSWAGLFIYNAAVNILKLPKEKRLNAIEQAPVYLQSRIKNEVTRIWRLRK